MAKTNEKKKGDVVAKLLDLEGELRADIDDQPDYIKAHLNNVLGAIASLKSTLTTQKSQERPPPRER